MGETGMLPAVFVIRTRYGTPLLGIFFSSAGVLLLSSLSFQDLVAAQNYLYCFGMFAELVAFIWLRIKKPGIARPYKVPLGTVGVIILCLLPSLLLVLVVAFASFKVMAASIIAVLIGFVLRACFVFVKKNKWVNFVTVSELPCAHCDLIVPDAEVGLLSTEST
jgi:amino acid transporter